MVKRCGAFLLIALLSGLLCSHVLGQSVIQNTYTVEPYNAWPWYRGAVNAENGFTMLTRPLHMGADTAFKIGLIRTDSVGAVLETRVLLSEGWSDAPVHILRSPNGMGWIVGMHRSSWDGHDALLMRIDQADEVVWARTFPLEMQRNATVFDVVETSDGGVAILCSKDPAPGESITPFVIRTDIEGNVLWCTEVLTQDPAQLWYMDVLPTDELVLSGGVIDSSGNRDVFIAGLDEDGSSSWARAFGGEGDDMAKRIVYDPWYGLVTAGYTGQDSGFGEGLVLRTDVYGEGQQALHYGSSVYDAHAFPDGSLMLFARVPAGTQMVRLDAAGAPMWATVLELNIGEGRLLPYAEASRFAYFSGDWFETVALNTFTAQCVSCGQPGDLTVTGQPALLPERAVPIATADLGVSMMPLQVSLQAGVVTRSLDCLLTGLEESSVRSHDRLCEFSAGSSVTVTGFDRDRLVLVDMWGRTVHHPVVANNGSVDDRLTFPLPPLATGVYVLSDGSGSCLLSMMSSER